MKHMDDIRREVYQTGDKELIVKFFAEIQYLTDRVEKLEKKLRAAGGKNA